MAHDVIVVGAGTAGCIAARRLADAGHRVLVLEAGPAGRPPPALEALDATLALEREARFWPGSTAVTGSGRPAPHLEGRGVGGGSAVNGLVAMVGDRADYDAWAEDHGCDGWGWADLAPWLDAALATWPAPPAEPGPLSRAVTEAARNLGHPPAASSALVDLVGVAPVALMAVAGRRRSMADVHLPPPDRGGPADGENVAITVVGDTVIERILHHQGRATGVVAADGTRWEVDSVVLAAGALRSPGLLGRSGLLGPGPRPVQDHPSFVLPIELRTPGRNPPGDRPPITTVLRWSTGGDPGHHGSADATALVMDHVGSGPDGRSHGAVVVQLTGARSRGRLPTGGAEPLRFEPGWLDDADDRARLRAAVRHLGRLLAGPELRPVSRQVLADDQGTPLRRLLALDDGELDAWLVGHPGPVSHAAGTLAMGGGDAPVDPSGRLRGVDGIHVVDASVLPVLPAANLQVPVMAVADRLSRGLS